jgi:NAD(P)-dependent dehydrogenase (short-subunit alcohol dehydrogenase family)
MTDDKRVALVTGANRGLGLETCRQLARQGYKVILTARDEMKGKQAAAELAEGGLEVDFHLLDVTNSGSIQLLDAYIRREHKRLDVLINNAGVFLDKGDGGSVFKVATDTIRNTMDVNVYGPLMLIQMFVPWMKELGYGRVVNVSSGLGQLTEMDGGYTSYRLSKTALNALTRIVAAELGDANVLVNAVCPGWVKTDMGGPNADREVEQGVDTIVWLATLPDGAPTGRIFRDRKEIPW